jgi:porphobilinogen synthase
MKLAHRPRRNRRSPAIRELIAETELSPSQLIWPVFVQEGKNSAEQISTMPGVFRYSPDLLLKEIEKATQVGIHSFALFPALHEKLKDPKGSAALKSDGLLPSTIRKIKDKFPDVVVISDVALDPYSSDGHDGLVKNGEILNDESVEILCAMALVHAAAGADYVAPSDMMDGRVGAIRKTLDNESFTQTGILAYSAKYASAFYGPFREALGSAPKFGDKKTYQMDFRNSREAILEAKLDVQQGADIVMVKPALAYLDVIQAIRKTVQVPVAAYNVSGEYAMIKAAEKAGMLDGTKAMVEVLYSIKRAGADMILTYFAVEMAKFLQNGLKPKE